MAGKKPEQRLITDALSANLDNAVPALGLSSTGIDDDLGMFWGTFDKLLEHPLTDIVNKALSARGFTLSLENRLAALETAAVGRWAIVDKEDIRRVQEFTPCLHFDMPKKGKTGPLLKAFYGELSALQAEVAAIRREGSDSATEIDELKSKIETLEQEKASLQVECHKLGQQLQKMTRAQAAAAYAIESQNLLPSFLRIGVVRSVSISERLAVVNQGRQHVAVPFAVLLGPLAVGAQAVLAYRDGTLIHAFPAPFTAQLQWQQAKVLSVTRELVKVRDAKRTIHVLSFLQQIEVERLATLRRGSWVMLSSYEGEPYSFLPLVSDAGHEITMRFQERLIAAQVSSGKRRRRRRPSNHEEAA